MMRAHVLLCDHAQVEGNKLFISGAGISQVPIGVPTCVAILVYVPWDLANTRIPYELHLENSDGSKDLQSEGNPPGRVEIAGGFEVGRPPGATRGTPLEFMSVASVPPLPFTPGRYMWRLSINGEDNELWTVSFNLRP